MDEIERCLRANGRFAEEFPYAGFDARPRRRLAVVACMDARMMMLHEALGLETGDAHVIRNAGGIVTDDVLRSLLLSCHVLGTREILIINHTECGLLGLEDEELMRRLYGATGRWPVTPARFCGFRDLEENVRVQVSRVRSHPWVPSEAPVRGFIYDVASGKLEEVRGEVRRKGGD